MFYFWFYQFELSKSISDILVIALSYMNMLKVQKTTFEEIINAHKCHYCQSVKYVLLSDMTDNFHSFKM